MENSENRVIKDWKGWLELGESWKDLFGPEIAKERYFLKDRLKTLQDIPKKYVDQGRTMSENEKSALTFVKGEINKMEMVLYPNSNVRGIVKVVNAAKELVSNIGRQRSEEISWTPIGPIKDKNKQLPDGTVKDKAIEMSKEKNQSVGPKKESNGINKDMRNSKKNDKEPLIVKLKTGKEKQQGISR